MPYRPAFAVFLAALAWCSAAAQAAERPKVAVLGVAADDSLNQKSTQALEDLLLTALHGTGRFELLGRADIAGLIGFEKEQEVLGCSQDVSCVAQIAGALDVPLVGTASLGKFGSVTILSFKLIDTKAAKVIVRTSVNAASESELPAAVEKLADEVANACDKADCAAYAKKPVPQAALETAPAGPSRVLPWVGVVSAIALVGASAAFDTQAATSRDHRLEAIDFLPLAGYVAAATLGGFGIHGLVSR